MRILMLTNNFTPLLNGVTRSILTLSTELRRQGHHVLIVAPEAPVQKREPNVIRVPAVPNLLTRIYSVPLPVALGNIETTIDAFQPDVIHSHHPVLLGGAALRLAAKYDVPIVYTRHTRYEHYLETDSMKLKRLVVKLVDAYSALCDAVIVPSESIAHGIRKHGLRDTNIHVIPTGIDTRPFERADGKRFRRKHRIPNDTFLVGYIGRMEPEKNLQFLTRVLIAFLKKHPETRCLFVGDGTMKPAIRDACRKAKLDQRVHLIDTLDGTALADAYAALDLFVFASKSETQGLVILEAMAAGTPVVALDASGSRDVIKPTINGKLVKTHTERAMLRALESIAILSKSDQKKLRRRTRASIRSFSPEKYANRVTAVYQEVIDLHAKRPARDSAWLRVIDTLQRKWSLYGNAAVESAFFIA